ncbi:MAG: type pilus assembly protein PilP [Francisellaceae bacterium]|nr:type pilus assembly protein PilP [Francisellaceae bacterium]
MYINKHDYKSLLLIGLSVLAGCSNTPSSDTENFVKELKQTKAGQIEPLPIIHQYQPYTYHAQNSRNPFEKAQERDANKNNDNLPYGKGPHPDRHRKKEPLEAFPLDSFKMVGSLERGGINWALIVDKNGIIYRMGVGNYIGQNDGKIISITADSMNIKELVSDGQGSYRERATQLTIAH